MYGATAAYVRDCLKDATGTMKGRWAEAKALKEFFREHRYSIIFDEAQHGLADKAAVIEYFRAITDASAADPRYLRSQALPLLDHQATSRGGHGPGVLKCPPRGRALRPAAGQERRGHHRPTSMPDPPRMGASIGS